MINDENVNRNGKFIYNSKISIDDKGHRERRQSIPKCIEMLIEEI